MSMAQASLPVPFREDGPPLLFEFDDVPEVNEDGTYVDEGPPSKRKRVEGDEDEIARNRRASAGAKGKAGIVSPPPSPSGYLAYHREVPGCFAGN